TAIRPWSSSSESCSKNAPTEERFLNPRSKKFFTIILRYFTDYSGERSAYSADRYRATPRADIWIPRPTGSVYREERLTRRGLLTDIAADFALLRLRVSEYSAGRAGSSLNSSAQYEQEVR